MRNRALPESCQTAVRTRAASAVLVALGIGWLTLCGLNRAGRAMSAPIWRSDHSSAVVRAGTDAAASFTVRNWSTLPLHVSLEPTCGCEVLDQSEFVVPPLLTGSFTARINTKGYPQGEYTKVILIHLSAGPKAWRKVQTVVCRVK